MLNRECETEYIWSLNGGQFKEVKEEMKLKCLKEEMAMWCYEFL